MDSGDSASLGVISLSRNIMHLIANNHRKGFTRWQRILIINYTAEITKTPSIPHQEHQLFPFWQYLFPQKPRSRRASNGPQRSRSRNRAKYPNSSNGKPPLAAHRPRSTEAFMSEAEALAPSTSAPGSPGHLLWLFMFPWLWSTFARLFMLPSVKRFSWPSTSHPAPVRFQLISIWYIDKLLRPLRHYIVLHRMASLPYPGCPVGNQSRTHLVKHAAPNI